MITFETNYQIENDFWCELSYEKKKTNVCNDVCPKATEFIRAGIIKLCTEVKNDAV